MNVKIFCTFEEIMLVNYLFFKDLLTRNCYYSGDFFTAYRSGVLNRCARARTLNDFEFFQDIILVNSLFFQDLVIGHGAQSGELSIGFKYTERRIVQRIIFSKYHSGEVLAFIHLPFFKVVQLA
jgi:hypothetical protein